MNNYIIDLDELADDTAYYVAQCGIPLITCKDCKYWKANENMAITYGYCNYLETETNKDFYCADAEGKE